MKTINKLIDKVLCILYDINTDTLKRGCINCKNLVGCYCLENKRRFEKCTTSPFKLHFKRKKKINQHKISQFFLNLTCAILDILTSFLKSLFAIFILLCLIGLFMQM